jgi:hypothetical protein
VLFPPEIETVSSIEQRFELLADEAWVVFDLSLFFESEEGPPPETDYFHAILRTAGDTPQEYIIHTEDSDQEAFEGRTISAAIPGSLPLASDYTLIFRLTSDHTDDVETSVAIDNVHTAAVPVPPALVLGALGLCTSLVGCVRQRRSRS